MVAHWVNVHTMFKCGDEERDLGSLSNVLFHPLSSIIYFSHHCYRKRKREKSKIFKALRDLRNTQIVILDNNLINNIAYCMRIFPSNP